MTLPTVFRFFGAFALSIAVMLLVAGTSLGDPTPDEKAAIAADEQLLKQAKLAVDGPALLEFLKKHTLTDADQKRIAELVKQLGSDDFKVREKASTELVAIGPPALSQLRKAAGDPDAEVKRRAQDCLNAIQEGSRPALVTAAVRLIRVRQPEGTCAALLHYLPSAADETVEEEILNALLALGVRDGKADPALKAALEDKLAVRRAAAALVLARSGDAEQRKAVRPLLADADWKVRLRAAQGFLAGRDKTVIPSILALLTDAPPELAQQAVEMLGLVGGEQGPRLELGKTDADRKKCRDAWEAWWKANGDKLDLAKANVDLPWLDAKYQAREAGRRFVESVLKADWAMFQKSTDVPFCLAGFEVFKTREQLDQLFKDAKTNNQGTFKIKDVVNAEEYLKVAINDGEKNFLNQQRKEAVRIVWMEFQDGPGAGVQNVAVFVRLSGGQGRVIGIGMGKDGPKIEKPKTENNLN